MQDWEDYYQILGVSPDANAEQIKEAYRYKVNILHPDRLMGTPERIRRWAEEDLKKVNTAYALLSNPQRRQQYDAERLKKRTTSGDQQRTTATKKPRPEVHPPVIRFQNVAPYAKQVAFFFVRNVGGPFSKVLISKPPSWIKVIETLPLQGDSKLPMRLRIEAVGAQWGTFYSSHIAVRLDEAEARVKVELRTQEKPKRRLWRK